MNPYGAEQIEEERAFWYSYLPAAMCWAMKSMTAATREKTPGEPRAVVLLLLASHPLAQPTPQDTTPASVQVPPVLRHARGPPESPCWGGKVPFSPMPAAATWQSCITGQLYCSSQHSPVCFSPVPGAWVCAGKPHGKGRICPPSSFLVALPGSLTHFPERHH